MSNSDVVVLSFHQYWIIPQRSPSNIQHTPTFSIANSAMIIKKKKEKDYTWRKSGQIKYPDFFCSANINLAKTWEAPLL